MIGISGGFMTVIHLILKYPIIGILSFVTILAGEVNGYQFTGQISYEQMANVEHESEKIIENGIAMGSEFILSNLAFGLVSNKTM